MTHWMCYNCGYYLQSPEPPDRCPACNQVCAFSDVTCYRAECGGEKNIDPLLVGAALGTLATPKPQKSKPENTLSIPRTFTQQQIFKSEAKGTLLSVETFAQGQFFEGFSEQHKRRLMGLGKIETYGAGDTVFTAGTESRKLFFVEEGQVMVELPYGEGVFVPISIVAPTQAFSWSALVPPYRHTSTAVALSDTRVNALDRETLLKFIEHYPSEGIVLMGNLASLIASRLTSLEAELVEVLRESQSLPDVIHVQLRSVPKEVKP